MNVVVTGSKGFIARNLLARLSADPSCRITALDRSSSPDVWEAGLAEADAVFHLAGVNRPPDAVAFSADNTDLTRRLVDYLENRGRPYRLVFSSSTQATLDNPYGKSKLAAEQYLRTHVSVGQAVVFRLHGVFGKWCRPNYNSVVATFCHNIVHGLPLQVRDPDFLLRLSYIDDVVQALLDAVSGDLIPGVREAASVEPEYRITLGNLANSIQSFRDERTRLFLPPVGDPLQKALYSTYLSYLPEDGFSYALNLKTDDRGSLFELLKTPTAGQIFISSTKPGITRGNHYHNTKTEKFVVIQGEASIELRQVFDDKKIAYRVSGDRPQVVDIPPGYVHNITNVGQELLLTLFWANEVFDPGRPDTFFQPV